MDSRQIFEEGTGDGSTNCAVPEGIFRITDLPSTPGDFQTFLNFFYLSSTDSPHILTSIISTPHPPFHHHQLVSLLHLISLASYKHTTKGRHAAAIPFLFLISFNVRFVPGTIYVHACSVLSKVVFLKKKRCPDANVYPDPDPAVK
jgi:hypothetical protein